MESSSFWNPESTVLESGIQYRDPESTACNPESKTVLDSQLTCGEQVQRVGYITTKMLQPATDYIKIMRHV